MPWIRVKVCATNSVHYNHVLLTEKWQICRIIQEFLLYNLDSTTLNCPYNHFLQQPRFICPWIIITYKNYSPLFERGKLIFCLQYCLSIRLTLIQASVTWVLCSQSFGLSDVSFQAHVSCYSPMLDPVTLCVWVASSDNRVNRNSAWQLPRLNTWPESMKIAPVGCFMRQNSPSVCHVPTSGITMLRVEVTNNNNHNVPTGGGDTTTLYSSICWLLFD